MASPQASAGEIRNAVQIASTCTPATAILLSSLLLPKVEENADAATNTNSKKTVKLTIVSKNRGTVPSIVKARDKNIVPEDDLEQCKDQLSPKERSILATEVINATLKTLSDAIKAPCTGSTRRQGSSKDLVKSSARKGLRRSNSLPQSPLQPRSLNRVISSPNIATRESRSSSSASITSSGYRATAECARVAFAGLRALAGSKSHGVELPALQLENGMSVLIGKLVALGLDDLAVKELRILKKRLESLDMPKKAPGSRTTTTPTPQALAELLDFGDASFTGAKLGLVISTQLQILRLMASARNPKQIEEALRVLNTKHTSSPTQLLLLAAKESKDPKQLDKIARQIQTLSEIMLSLGPSISATEDARAQDARLSVPPQAAIKLQCLALHNRFLWWGLAGHKGELSKDIFKPFLQCLQAFARRSRIGTLETYRLASSLAKDLQSLLENDLDSQPRALKSTLQDIYRLLSSLSRDANIIADAIAWTDHMQRVLDPDLDSETKRCSVNARMLSLKLRRGWDSKDEELLLSLLEGLERPFKGKASEVDELMLEVSSARRFAIIALAENSVPSELRSKEQPTSGMRDMCEHLIFLCPRLCLRYLGNPPDVKSATKDIVCHEQRRQFITKVALHAIDSVLFLVRVVLGEGRLTWELVDSKLQDCLSLLDRILTDMVLDDGSPPMSYYARISNLYYSQFLNIRRSSDVKDGQQVRALRRSLESIRGRPQKERKAAQFTTKLERMAEFCKETGRYDELHKTLLALRDEMIGDGVLAGIAENASSRLLRSVWDADEQSATLGRTIQSIIKVHLKYLKSASQPSLVDISWSNEERGVVLEHQLDILANHTYSDTNASLQVDAFQALLSVYDAEKYPIRRLRVLLRLIILEKDKHEDLSRYLEELDPSETSAIQVAGSRDEGLRSFLDHFQILAATMIELRKVRPDVGKLKQSIAKWSLIRKRCKDISTFQNHVGDVSDLLAYLDTTANWLQMKGYGTVRVAALRLIADIHELRDDQSNSDELVSSLSDLGAQWLQLGYSGKAGLALERAKTYNHRNGISAYALLQLHLSYCEYWMAIGSVDKVDEHMSCAQAIYIQEHDVLERTNSTSKLQHRTRMNILVSGAHAVHSMLAAERGITQIALSHAKKSVRLLRRAWSSIESDIPNQLKPKGSITQNEVEKLGDDLSELSLASSEISLTGASQEICLGTSLWGLITPLFQSLSRLSELFAHHGLFQETIYYAEQAHKLAKEVGSESLLATASVLLGKTWLKAGSLDKGSEFLIHAEQFCSKSHESRERAILRYHMGSMHGLLGNQDAEITAYASAEASLKTLTSADYIRGLESVVDESSSIEDEMAKLFLKQNKPPAPRKIAGRPKKTVARKATTRAKSPVEAMSPAEECPPLVSLKGVILRQRARALMMTKNFADALNLLQEAENYINTKVELVDHGLSMARQLLLQSLEQMNADPVYSVLQDSTISFPSVAGPIKTEKHGDRSSVVKVSPPRKMIVMRSSRDRTGSRSPAPDSFFDKLRQAQEHLMEAHAIATVAAPMITIHNTSALLNSVAILLSAAGQVKGRFLAHPGLASCSVETARMIALRRERKAILSEPRMALRLDEAAWPQLQSVDQRRSSLGLPSDMSRFQKDFIDIIPKAWSVISISLSDTRDELSITKLHAGQSPFVLRLPLGRHNSIDADEEVFGFDQGRAELLEIIKLANETAHDARNRIGKEARISWWEEREALDARLRDLLENVEKVWLGGFTGIFSQHARRPNLLARFQKSFQNILDKHLPSRQKTAKRSAGPRITLDTRILELFIGLGDASDEKYDLSEPLNDLLYFVVDVLQFQGELNAYAEIDFDSIVVETHDALRGYHAAANTSGRTSEDRHTILVLDKALHSFPWESLPCMEGLAVSRLPSLGCLRERILAQEMDLGRNGPEGHYINREHGSYILNPGGDLKDTEKTFQTDLQSLNSWDAIISRKPSEDDFKEALVSKDLLLYFGHGSGAQYIRAREIKRLEKCAVTMLMGCSSGALVETGEFESYGSPINYMHAGCPALVATLWDVTDKDIDRFAKSTLEHWGLFDTKTAGKAKGRKREDSVDQIVSLVEAVARGRSACHLRYLNAASVCVYGIPVYFR